MRLLIGLAAACACAIAADVRVIVSSAAGDRLAEKPGLSFERAAPAGPAITVDASRRFQTIEGIGATFTEAGLMVLNKLPRARQEETLRKLFDARQGAGFTLMKSPLAAFDFASAGPWYSYDDTPGDVELRHFSIARDLGENGLVTFIKRARRYGAFKLQSTMDYPPDWMLDEKTNLKPEHYGTYARYAVKYLQAYRDQGVAIDFLSPFNEPQYIYCKITYDQVREVIKNHLGPELVKSGLKTRLQVSDAHNRAIGLKDFPTVLDDPDARKYIHSMPLHGYSWDKQGSEPMAKLHARYAELPAWQSEVCYAKVIDKREMPVHGFDDGDRWGRMLIADFRNWAAGWIYWNMILDHKGGPWLVSPEHRNPDDNSQHPVVIIDTEKQEVEYTGLYYYLAHFSRYVRPGAVRIGSDGTIAGLEFVAFENGNGKVLEVVNSSERAVEFAIHDGGRTAAAALPAKSIGTFLWK